MLALVAGVASGCRAGGRGDGTGATVPAPLTLPPERVRHVAAPADRPGEPAPAAGAAAAQEVEAPKPPAVTPPGPSLAALRREAHRVMDDWHAAATAGDRQRYLGHLADDAVFLGTDATERWDMATFRTYVETYMAPGKGWPYSPSERGLVVPEGSEYAWFDERLATPTYGEVRGTGVLRRDGESWRIVHYSMTFTVPNDVAKDVVARIRARGQGATGGPSQDS